MYMCLARSGREGVPAAAAADSAGPRRTLAQNSFNYI